MSTKRRASRGEKDHFQFAFFEMKIIDIRPTTITVPLEAPLRHEFIEIVVERAFDNVRRNGCRKLGPDRLPHR